MQLTTILKQFPLIAVLRGVKPSEVLAIADVLLTAGFKCIEVPLNSPDPLTSVELLAKKFGQHTLIGAGTVTQAQQVTQVAERGGKLIIMPHADTQIIQAAKQANLCCIPGFATATEAFAAISAGADALKLFPAEAYPPAVLKAFLAVIPSSIPILPVGSITPDVMKGYWKVGAKGFGLGSALYRPNDSASDVARKAKLFAESLQQFTYH